MTAPVTQNTPLSAQIKPRRDAARDEVKQQKSAMREFLAAAEARSTEGKILASDQREFDRMQREYDRLEDEADAFQERYEELVDLEIRQASAAQSRRLIHGLGEYDHDGQGHVRAAQAVGSPVRVNEPNIYDRGNGNSYFRDLGMAALGDPRGTGAFDRLRRHSQHMTESRALGNTGAIGGSGGDFAPPAWFVNEWIPKLRAARVTANLMKHGDVPPGVSSINLPRVITGTSTALQTTQNTALAQTDLTTGFVQTGFATIGGKQVSSQQLLDQSGVDFDTVILDDLGADYNLQVGTQIFTGAGNGTGTGAVVNGLNNAVFGTTTTWTTNSPTIAGFYGQCAKTLAAFQTTRFAPPLCWVFHPRRWYWLMGASDANQRPLIVPQGDGYNPIAVNDGVPAQGMAGMYLGLPVFIDSNVPITMGAGNNQDNVYLMKTDDLWLFEKVMAPEAFRETLADSLSVLFRLYGYVGTVLNRYAASLAVIQGTGLTPPAFAS